MYIVYYFADRTYKVAVLCQSNEEVDLYETVCLDTVSDDSVVKIRCEYWIMT